MNSGLIESVFAGVRLRTNVTKRMRRRDSALYLVFKITRRLELGWRPLDGGLTLMTLLLRGARFVDGIYIPCEREISQNPRAAVPAAGHRLALAELAADDAAQAGDRPRLRGTHRGGDGSSGRGRCRLQAPPGARRQPCGRLPALSAHSLVAAGLRRVPDEKLAALWEYPTSPLYSEPEPPSTSLWRPVAVPNAVTSDHFASLRRHWSDVQIVEMLAAVCLYGFLYR